MIFDHVKLDATSHTMQLVNWLEWFERTNGFVPTRVIVQRGLMQAVCYENGLPTNFSEYGLVGVAIGVIADA